MIIDTSALVAVLDQEPEAERIARTLASTSERMLSAANLVVIISRLRSKKSLCREVPVVGRGAAYAESAGPL
jgi:uncharacterized protein with PIN domain